MLFSSILLAFQEAHSAPIEYSLIFITVEGKREKKVSLALLSLFFPSLGCLGAAAALGACCKAVPLLHCFAYTILNLSSG